MYVALGEFLNIQNILNTFRSIIVFLNCIIFGKINKKKFEPFFIINILLRCHKMSSLSFIFSPQCNWLSATSKKRNSKFSLFELELYMWLTVQNHLNLELLHMQETIFCKTPRWTLLVWSHHFLVKENSTNLKGLMNE